MNIYRGSCYNKRKTQNYIKITEKQSKKNRKREYNDQDWSDVHADKEADSKASVILDLLKPYISSIHKEYKMNILFLSWKLLLGIFSLVHIMPQGYLLTILCIILKLEKTI